MHEYVALLRGVNVGGKSLDMASVVELCGSLGLDAPRSYIQSGNILFNLGALAREGLEARLEREIREHLSFELSVILRTRGELAAIAAGNPFAGRMGAEPRSLYVTFLAAPAGEADAATLPPPGDSADQFRVAGAEIYLHCPGGYGRTLYSNSFFERRLGIPATTRNWNTVSKLLELARGE